MIIFLLLVIIILLLLVFYWLQQWQHRKPGFSEQPPQPPRRFRLPDYDHNHDLILMVKPGFTITDVLAYIKRNFPHLNREPEIKPYCQSCDNLLFSVIGFTFKVLGQTGESPKDPGPSQPVKQSGDEVPFLYTPNYKIKLPKPARSVAGSVTSRPVPPPGAEAGDPVLVAILDTGLNENVAKNYKTEPVSYCRGTLGLYGYNVVADNSNTADDFTGASNTFVGHGTPVTGLVLRYASRWVNVKILPVKVLNDKGQSTLLQLMCGLAYAKNAGAKIINASLGFYAADPLQVIFFKEFLDRLTNDNTLIIAAAGNEEIEEDKLAQNEVGAENLRNLDQHLFYPAAFSGFNSNIITATTVSAPASNQYTTAAATGMRVSPRQNYSATKVQIGVQADVEVAMQPSNDGGSQAPMDYVFLNPYGQEPGEEGWKLWNGSSFAAPVFTGLVAATYYQYLEERNGVYKRDDYLQWLVQNEHLKKKVDMVEGNDTETDKVPSLLLMKPDEQYYISLENAAAPQKV